MGETTKFYVGYKGCGCPVAAVNAGGAPRDVIAKLVGEMVLNGYRVNSTTELPDAFLYESCMHDVEGAPEIQR